MKLQEKLRLRVLKNSQDHTLLLVNLLPQFVFFPYSKGHIFISKLKLCHILFNHIFPIFLGPTSTSLETIYGQPLTLSHSCISFFG